MTKTKIPKITSAYLKKWLQGEFDRFEIKLTVKDCFKTRFRGQDYEAGAAVYILSVGNVDSKHDAQVFCHIPKNELQRALDMGKKLVWVPRDYQWVNDSTISYR
jgi:hypothetical protein